MQEPPLARRLLRFLGHCVAADRPFEACRRWSGTA